MKQEPRVAYQQHHYSISLAVAVLRHFGNTADTFHLGHLGRKQIETRQTGQSSPLNSNRDIFLCHLHWRCCSVVAHASKKQLPSAGTSTLLRPLARRRLSRRAAWVSRSFSRSKAWWTLALFAFRIVFECLRRLVFLSLWSGLLSSEELVPELGWYERSPSSFIGWNTFARGSLSDSSHCVWSSFSTVETCLRFQWCFSAVPEVPVLKLSKWHVNDAPFMWCWRYGFLETCKVLCMIVLLCWTVKTI